MKDEIGEDEFNDYALEFFKNTNIDYKTFFMSKDQVPNQLAVLAAKNTSIN